MLVLNNLLWEETGEKSSSSFSGRTRSTYRRLGEACASKDMLTTTFIVVLQVSRTKFSQTTRYYIKDYKYSLG